VLRATTVRDNASEGGFVERCAWKCQRKTLDARFGLTGQHGDGAGVQTAGKKKSHRNVSDEVRFDSVFQERSQMAGGGRKFPGAVGIASGRTAGSVVPRSGARNAAALGNVHQHFVAGRQGKNTFEKSDWLRNAAK
jgi:hypothetical protein